MAKKQYCIPFIDGSMADYVGWELTEEEKELCRKDGTYSRQDAVGWITRVEWRPNVPFMATLQYDGFTRGLHKAKFVYKDSDGHTHSMFMPEMDKLIKMGVAPLNITGMFQYVKRGTNYGIRLIEVTG